MPAWIVPRTALRGARGTRVCVRTCPVMRLPEESMPSAERTVVQRTALRV